MSFFTLIFLKLISLYGLIALGFVARKKLDVEREGIARLLLYIIVPAVFFAGAMHTPITFGLILLPFVVALISCGLCLAFFRIGGRYWQDTTRHLLAFTAGNANTGYFGLPIALMLFDGAGVGIYLTLILGFLIYENTLGFFTIARGRHTAAEAAEKLLRLPTLYAFVLGALLHACGLELPQFTDDFFSYMRGAYTVLGMMIIGMGLASVTLAHLDWRFIGFAFLAKFVCYPLIALLLVALDVHLLHGFTATVHEAFLLMSLMPLAANSVVFATLFRAHSEKAAASVFLSTLFTLVYVPLMVTWMIK